MQFNLEQKHQAKYLKYKAKYTRLNYLLSGGNDKELQKLIDEFTTKWKPYHETYIATVTANKTANINKNIRIDKTSFLPTGDSIEEFISINKTIKHVSKPAINSLYALLRHICKTIKEDKDIPENNKEAKAISKYKEIIKLSQQNTILSFQDYIPEIFKSIELPVLY